MSLLRSSFVLMWLLGLTTGTLSRADFMVHDLGLLTGGTFSRGLGINSTGQVAGVGDVQVASVLVQHALLAQKGFLPIDVSITTGTHSSIGRGINDGGAIAGSTQDVGGLRAARFDGGSVTIITLLPGGVSSQGYGIDGAGNVVGSVTLAGGVTHGFRSDALGGMSDLGVIAPGQSSEALATNAAGVTVGDAIDGTGRMRGVRAGVGGGFVLLPALLPGGSSSAATGINSLGHIVGFADRFGSVRAVFLKADNTWQELGLLFGGTTARANAINTSDMIVGQADSGAGSRAFLTDATSGVIVDLNTRIDPSSGWTLTSATGINDQGFITGVGQINGQDRAFLLTPTTIPEPASLVLLFMGGLLLAGSRIALKRGRSTGRGVAGSAVASREG